MKAQSLKKDSKTNWERLATMPDSKIDVSDVSELGNDFFANATLRLPEPKKAISLRIDSDILDWYRKRGTGYQTVMNAVLRLYMQAKRPTGRKISSRRSRSLKHVA
jgi:uncharacterized protein (DUF4415 family)